MSPPAPALRLAGAPHCLDSEGRAVALGVQDGLLLAWLAVEGPTPRERLATLLWPDSAAEAARNALRQRLFRLRRQCGAELASGNPLLALAEGVRHDLADAATLLGDLTPEMGGPLRDWLQDQRQQRRERERRRLTERIAALEASGEPGAALPLAEALLALDPLREDAHQRLMRLHYLLGDRSAALQAFDRCEQLLKHELGARPAPETLALLATIEAAERGAVPLPGQQRPLPAALARPPRLVGRAAERARLAQALAGGGRLLLSGEAGLGKSRLLQAALADAAAPALLVAARPGDALVPYALLARLLRAVQQRTPAALDAAVAGHLAALLPERAGAQAATPPRPDELLRAVLAVLQAAATGPAGCRAFALDDLHFADEATLQLLPQWLAATPAAASAWLLSLRPPAEGSAQARLVGELAASSALETLALRPLDDAALAELVDSLALPGVAGAALAAPLRARSGGNPLFALETLKLAWTEGQALAAGTLPRPRSVGQLIDATLAALSPEALLLARVAAIAGVDFSVELAAQVLGRHPLQLADAWSELEARQVMRGPAFAHDLMHEATLAGIPEVLARHTHGSVAAWLQAQGGEPARVAAHWEAAGRREQALPALRAAAERAHAALREPERVDFLLRAADIAEAQQPPRLDEAFGLVNQAIDAHMNTVRDAAGQPLLDRLDRLARTPHQRAVAAGQRAWYSTTQGEWAEAIARGHEALALSQACDDAALQASVSQRLGTALGMAGRFDEALPRLRAAEPWVQAQAGSDRAAEFLGNLAAVLDNLGRPAEAQPYHQRVIEATCALGDASFQATARANLAVSRLNAGDVDGALEQLGLAQQLVSRYELQGASAGFIAALQAQAARARGHYAAALQWCDGAEALLASASPGWLPVVHMHRAQLWLELGQPARAQQALAACAPESLPPRLRARHLGLRGRLLQALGQDPAAALAQALALAPTTGWPELRLTIGIEHAGVLPQPERIVALRAVADEAAALGLQGVVLAARLRLARQAEDPALALAAADAALAQMGAAAPGGIEPNALYRGERWLGPAHAALAAGQPARAAALAGAGWQWVQRTADAQVPPPFRDAFLNRQPLNQALRRLLPAD